MKIIDKHNLIENIQKKQDDLVLELGCGNQKRIEGSIGIDILNYDEVDIVGDVYDVLSLMPSDSISAVYSSHFFEHVENPSKLIDEITRILIPQGKIEIVVPHFSNPYFYSDYTHKLFYGLYSFSYLSQDNIFARKTPNYQKEMKLNLESVRLVFKSNKPFIFRHGIKKYLLENIFNSTNWIKEFYEENLCYVCPCYELHFSLKKIESSK